MGQAYDGKLLSNKKEWLFIKYNMNEYQMHYTEWKTVLKVYTYDSISVTFLKWQNYTDEKQMRLPRTGCDYKERERGSFVAWGNCSVSSLW